MLSRILLPVAALTLMGLAACSSSASQPTNPENQAASDSPLTAFAPFAVREFEPGATTAVIGEYRLVLDRATLNAHVEPLHRTNSAIADTFGLPVQQFGLFPRIIGVSLDPTGLVVIKYAVDHPFKAPASLTQPATASNRADLGIAGRMVFVLPAPAGRIVDPNSPLNKDDYEFPTSPAGTFVVANGKVITNADGLIDPGGMLDTADFSPQNGTNRWPYKVLVDEALDPRTDTATGLAITNNGRDDGNYAGTTGGWQRSNIGSANNGWTGFGVLHQGQTARNSINLDLSALTTPTFALEFAVIAKYEDPRGGSSSAEKRTNRLPSATGDITAFAYYEPFGALDMESIRFQGLESGNPLGSGIGSTDNVVLHIVDLDGEATVDPAFPGTQLGSIPNTSRPDSYSASAGEMGFAIDPPNPPDSGSGTNTAPYVYTVPITNTSGSTGGSDGCIWVMVEISDDMGNSNLAACLDNSVPPVPLTGPCPAEHVSVLTCVPN
ncbi:MAG: hypothetical protein ABI743_05100, partial [bacterium]